MHISETSLQKTKRRTLELEEQLIAHIHLIAVLASKGLDTSEAESRLKSLKETLDFVYEVLAHHETIDATLQHQFR
jgi:hypothetical protein